MLRLPAVAGRFYPANPNELAYVVRRMTALRAANARLQAIFDHAPVWLSLRGMDGRYLDANTELGLPVDAREYSTGAQMLTDLGLHSLRLLTNNPAKVDGLSGFGIEVAGRCALPVLVTEENFRYLTAKRDRLGHQLDNLILPNGAAPAAQPAKAR